MLFRSGRGAVEHVADVGVGWDFRDAEQGLAVGASVAFVQPALVGEERGAAHEEHRERRQSDVGHRVGETARRLLAPIGQAGAGRSEVANQGFEDAHAASESETQPRRQGETSDGRSNPRRVWQIGLSEGRANGEKRSQLELLGNQCRLVRYGHKKSTG